MFVQWNFEQYFSYILAVSCFGGRTEIAGENHPPGAGN